MTAAGPAVAGVVLAAGRSERFAGAPSKLVAELAGEPLVRRVVLAALGSRLRQVLVVLGHAAAEVRRALAGLAVEWVDNPDYAAGQSTSVRAGMARVAPSMRAAMVLPGDQPLVSSALVDRLIAAYVETSGPIVRPCAGGRPGTPVLWDRSLFPELAVLVGDAGGRQVMERHAGEVLEVEIEDPLALADVDTVADLRRLEGVAGGWRSARQPGRRLRRELAGS
ncbi:MAG TPA: nucleotidyltransferase family protein [Thermoanaerobaculia bacterium]